MSMTMGIIASVGVVVGGLAPASVANAAGPVTDNFDSGTYSGGTGWAVGDDWVEVGDDGLPGDGRIEIVSGVLRFENIDSRYIERSIDLSGFSPGAQVSLSVPSPHDNDEALKIQFYDGSAGDGFTTVFTTNDEMVNTAEVTYQLDNGMLRSDGKIRIAGADASWGSESVRLDNLEISEPTANPDLPPGCGIDVVLVLDESGSIGSTYDQDVEAATRAFVSALSGTGSRLRIVEFSNNAREANLGAAGFQVVDASLETAVENYLTVNSATNAQSPNSYNPGSGQQYTNWEAGLAQAALNPGDLVVFMTDGSPNTVGTAGNSTDSNGGGSASSAAAAVDEIDAIKASPAHVLGVGVGAASNAANWLLLHSTVEPYNADLWLGSGDLDMRTVDAIRVGDFSQLVNALRLIVYAQCAPSVNITKRDDAGTAIPTWEFVGTVDILNGDRYEWISPVTGQTLDNGSGLDVPQTAPGPGVDGDALFQWVPGTADDPEVWNSRFRFTEVLPPGWTLPTTQPDCSVSRLDEDDPFAVQLVVTAGPDASGLVSFGLEQSGSEFVIQKSDIVTCDVHNNRPGSITITKDADPDNEQDFSFTGDRTGPGTDLLAAEGTIVLDDDTDGTNSNTSGPVLVEAGAYTITEGTLPAGWTLTGVSGDCSRVGSSQDAVITVAPGESATCTFTNTGTANLELEKLWVIAEPGDTATVTADIPGGGVDLTLAAVADGGGSGPVVNETDTSTTIAIPIGTGVALAETLGQPADYTSSLVCESTGSNADFGLTGVAGDGRSGTVTATASAIGQTITCRFANPSKQVDVVVEKAVVGPANDPGVFELYVDDELEASGGDGATNTGDAVVVDIGDSVEVYEAVAAGTDASHYVLGAPVCSYPGGSIAATLGLDGHYDFDVPLDAAGQTITCLFTNTRKSAELRVAKAWVDAVAGDDVSISSSGSVNSPSLSSEATASDTTDNGDFVTVYAGETLTLDEDVGPDGDADNYTTTLDCGSGAIALDTDLKGSFTVPSTVASTDEITCTYTNARKPVTIKVVKELVPSDDTGTFDLSINGVVERQDAGHTDFGTAPAHAGDAIVVSEEVNSDYTSQLECDSGVVPNPNTGTSGGFTVPNDLAVGATITCTFANTRKQAGIYIQKAWSDGLAGDQAVIDGDTASNFTTKVTDTATAPDALAGDGLQVDAQSGETVYFRETLQGAANGRYDASWECVSTTAAGVPTVLDNGAGATGSLLVTSAIADAVDAGATVTCTITNSRRTTPIVLTKSWVGPTDAASNVDLTISGTVGVDVVATPVDGYDDHDGAGDPAGAADSDATATGFVGGTVSLAETDLTNYTDSLSCERSDTGATISLSGAAGDQLVVPDLPDGVSVSCEFVNTRIETTVSLEKTWVNGYYNATTPDTAALDVDVNAVDTPAADADVPASGNGTVTPTATTNVTVYAGDSVTVSETLPPGNLGTYTTTLVCTGDNAPVAEMSRTFSVPASTDPITCGFENRRTERQFTLAKTWADPLATADPTESVHVGLNASGNDPLSGTIDADADSPTGNSDSFTVFSGETVVFDETFDSGTELGFFSTGLVCADGVGADVNPSILTGATDRRSSVSVDDFADDITCTFDNTRKEVTVNLAKSWVDPAAGDTYTLDIDGTNDDTDVAVAPASDGASAQQSTVTAYAGESLTLSESADDGTAPPNTGTYVVDDFDCTGVTANDWSHTAGASTASLDVPAVDGPVTCTYTNKRNTSTLTVVKDWVDPGNGPASATISATGGSDVTDTSTVVANPTAGSTVPSPGGDGSVTIDIRSGESITVQEVFDATGDNLDGSHFTSTLQCTGDNAPVEQTSRVIPIGDDPAPITCTFVNTRKSTTLVLEKDWVAEVTGDDVDLSIETDTDPATTAVANGDASTSEETASITAYSGADYDLTEVIDTSGNTAIYDPTGLVCDGENAATGFSGDTDGATGNVLIDPDDTGAQSDVTCTFTNEAQRGTIVIVKNIEGTNDQLGTTFGFNGDWPDAGDPAGDFDIATTNGTGSATYNDVLVSADGYTVAEDTDNPEYDGTKVFCAESGNSADNGSTPTSGAPGMSEPLSGSIDLDADETVTCTFTNTQRSTIVVIKDAEPNSLQDFRFDFTEPAGGDFLPAFDVLDDDAGVTGADATNSTTFTSGLLPANASYTATEAVALTPGWTLDVANSSCSAGGSFNGATATITPAPGETVTCTFVNTANPVGLTATKLVDGVVGPWGPFDFTLDPNPVTDPVQLATQQVDSNDTTASWEELAEGVTYTLTEADADGYTEGSFTCSVTPAGGQATDLDDADDQLDGFQFVAVAGAVYSCSITNTAIDPTLVIEKTTVGGVGTFDFDIVADPTDGANDASATETSVTTTSADVAKASSTLTLVAGEGYTVTEDDPGTGWSAGDLTCEVTHAGETSAVTYTANDATQPGDEIVCEITNTKRGEVTVDKADPTEVTRVGTTYTATYQITVANESYVDETYTVTDTPDMADNVTIQTMVVTGPGLAPTGIDIAPAGGTVISGATIAARAGQSGGPAALVYTVVTTFTLEPVTSTVLDESQECVTVETDYVSGNGAYNGVSVFFNEVLGETTNTDDACIDLPEAELDVTKTGSVGPAVLIGPATNRYEATYTVEVKNTGDGPGSYGLSDLPDLAAGATNVAVEFVGGEPTWPLTINGGTVAVPAVHTYTVKVAFDVAGSMTTEERTCATVDTPDRGAYNKVTMTIGDGSTDVDTGCVDIPEPDITRTKTSDSIVRTGDGTFTVSYTLTVTNAVGAGPAVYDLDDDVTVGTGVTIDEIRVTSAPVGVTPTVGAAGVTADDVAIDAGETAHTYTVEVDLTIAVVDGVDGLCDPRTDGGISNSLTIDVRDDQGDPTEVCDDFATLTLIKETPNDDGADLGPDAFTLTARQGVATVLEGPGPEVAAAVLPGDYDLDESPRPDGYTITGFTCGAASMTDQTVTVEAGANVECTIVNDDEPVDLQITKNDDGLTQIAGGAPFDYTIELQNIGDRDVDLDEPVTVTDTLPDGLSWVSFPATCDQVGQVLTCDVDPASLPAGGDPIVIVVTVGADADAASGTYVNKVSVTTEDDPATDAECPALDDNNIDCEETPVDRSGAIQIIKTDDVADGETVMPGESYSYELVVTNVGTSTILPGLVATDDLPTQLSLVSVTGGAGWSCNATDPIECTYAPELAPAVSAPVITVEVSVNADAAGTAIDNVADVIGAVDRDCPPVDLVEAFEPACNEVTDDDDEQTPLTALADLAIVKTANVDTIGAGNDIVWTLEITNIGPSTAINVVIGDLMPADVTVDAVTSSDFACGHTGNTIECTVASLAAGASGTVQITTGVPDDHEAGTVNNIGTVESDTPDPDLDNNSDDDSVVIVAQRPPVTAAPPTSTLPPTGSNSTSPMLQLGFVFLLLGVAGVAITRRRTHTTTV